MKDLKEDVDWSYYIPKDQGTTVHIRLLSGKFKDVTYQYGKVGFDEEKDGAVYLRFIYNVIESASHIKEELEKSDEFKNHIGDILTTIISANLDKGINDETGTDYSEEPDLQ